METNHRLSQGQSYFITSNGALTVFDGTLEILKIEKAGQYSFVATSDEIKIVTVENTTYKVTVNFNDAPIELNGGIETEGYVTFKEVGWDEAKNIPIFEIEVHNSDKFVNQKLFLSCFDFENWLLWGVGRYTKPIVMENILNCNSMMKGSTSFNQPLSLPNATSCSSMLDLATSFNQPLSLPKAIHCGSMLSEATSFNQPLSLPKAIRCDAILFRATSFNQPLSLPNATSCSSMLFEATSFNSHLSVPKAIHCDSILYGATSFNQPIELPSATNCTSAFRDTALSAENINFILRSLPDRTGLAKATITFTGSPGAKTCDASIGTAKNWTVQV